MKEQFCMLYLFDWKTAKNPNHISDKKHDSDNSVQQMKPNPSQKRLLP